MLTVAYSKVFETDVEIVGMHFDTDGIPVYHGMLNDDDGETFLLFREHELENFRGSLLKFLRKVSIQ